MKAWNNTQDMGMKYTASSLVLPLKTEARCNQLNLLGETLLTPSTLRAELFVHPPFRCALDVFIGRYAGRCVECVATAPGVCLLLAFTCVGLRYRLGMCVSVRGGCGRSGECV